MRTVFAVLASVPLLTPVAAGVGAEPRCTCRTTEGAEVEKGQLACLHLPEGYELARCDIVLNNTSWTRIRDGCPESRRTGHLRMDPT